MKKLIVTAIAGVCALSVFAQGTITFNNYLSGKVQTHIYGPNSTAPSLSQVGNAATGDLPVGTTSWAGFLMVGAAGGLAGNTTWTALLAAPGQGALESSLQPATAGGITSFRSGAGAGIIYATTPTFGNISPDFAGGATVEMVAWDNSSGLYSTWALAKDAWLSGKIAGGSSGLFNITASIGGTLATPPNMLGLRSFNLYLVPEPSSFALMGLGAAALLVLRRRK